MSSDDEGGEEVPITVEDETSPRDRIEREAERAVEGFDSGVIDVLGWLLETETKSRIYVHLRREPGSTSEEIAQGTGLYPSTVREALAELYEDDIVTRTKRESEGAGNNPFEYEAIAPSNLVGEMISQVQDQLNTVFNLDAYVREDEPRTETEPITISVEEVEDPPEDEETDDDADER